MKCRSNDCQSFGKYAFGLWQKTVESDINEHKSVSACCLENDAAYTIDFPVQRKQFVNL